ncbi:MAG: M48 family metalloprotease [Pseudomonadota bacterium]
MPQGFFSRKKGFLPVIGPGCLHRRIMHHTSCSGDHGHGHGGDHGGDHGDHHGGCSAISRRSFAKAGLAGLGLVGLTACSVNPATGRYNFGSIEDDVSTGRAQHPEVLRAFGGAYQDPKLAAYVTDIGQELVRKTEFPNLAFTFTVLNTPTVNAFAIPGGYVYLTRGLLALASNEAEMAGVIGHEIGHVIARHGSERQTQGMFAQIGAAAVAIATGSPELANLAQMGGQAYIQSYSRDQEFEADTLGVEYMSATGYDPQAMATFLSTLRDFSKLEAVKAGRNPNTVDQSNWLATHPRTIDRVEKAIRDAALEKPPNAVIRRDRYLQNINGMLYGDDPKEGIIRGQEFIHPDLRFEFEAPEGFRLQNSPTRVVASNGRNAAMIFTMAASVSGSPATYLSNEISGEMRLSNIERLRVNGLQAAVGRTRMRTQNGLTDLLVAAIEAPDNRVYRFTFLTRAGQLGTFEPSFLGTVRSFRRLTQAQANRIRAYRVVVVTARRRDTVARLSRNMPFGRFNEETFRLLNDLVGDQEPTAGEEIKVIAA